MAKTKSKTNSRTTRTSARGAAKRGRKTVSKARSNARQAKDPNGSMLEQYFLNALKDIYWAENALTKALPKMSKEATSSKLKKAFTDHLAVTKKQIERLKDVFGKMGKKAQGKKCDAMHGLVKESEGIMKETKDDTSTRDAALIISAQKVEHYEIATYGGLVQLARTLKRNDVAKILETTLREEKKTDELLTKIAEKGGVNEEAAGEEAAEPTLKENIMAIFS